MSEPKKSHWKRWSWLPKLALTVLAFAFVLQNVDFEQLSGMLARQDHSLLFFVGMSALGQMWAGAIRWQIILRKLSDAAVIIPRHARILLIYYISIFFNCCLPGTVGGDVVRVWLAKNERIPLHLAIHSVVVDRILTLMGLLIMVFFAMPYVCAQAGLNVWAVMTPLALAPIIGIILLINLHRLPQAWRATRIGGLLAHLATSVREIVTHPATFVSATALAMLGHVGYCVAAFMLAQSLNIDLTIVESLTYMPIILLISVLPISIGGWGVREAGMVSLLALSGVPASSALVLSVQLALIILLVSLPGGLLWLFKRGQARMNKLEAMS